MTILDGASLVLGERAPGFVLPNVHGAQVDLDELAGKRALLVFYPFAFTGICSNELSELRDNLNLFEAANTTVVAISCDPLPALKAWDAQEAFGFELLSDFWPHGAAAQAYGVFDSNAGRAQRGSFLLDETGVLRWSVVNEPGHARPLSGYLAALDSSF